MNKNASEVCAGNGAGSPTENLLVPLLDALGWNGSAQKLKEGRARASEGSSMDDLIETLSNLKYRHINLGKIRGEDLREEWLPIVMTRADSHCVVIKLDRQQGLVFDGETACYCSKSIHEIHGNVHLFKYQSISQGNRKNWFLDLMLQFKASFNQMIGLTFVMTLLDLLIPTFVVLIYSIVAQSNSDQSILWIGAGILIYLTTYALLAFYRTRITDYVSARMGLAISEETFSRLLYLPPSYTETATISSQVNRIKDFENLKRFVTSGMFLNLLDLCFAFFYLLIIFAWGKWLVAVPVVTLIVVFGLGFLFRPLYKLKMENVSEKNNLRQQLLMEILKHSQQIKNSSVKANWLSRYRELGADHIFSKYELNEYVSLTNGISNGITQLSALIFIYGGVLQIFDDQLTVGVFIGLLMLYWKVSGAINGAFSLFVQFNGLAKSIQQINRFMNLPQDTHPEGGKKPFRPMKGQVIFKEVSMRYSNQAAGALVNINLSVQPGTIFGVTGHDGSGKTTLLKLILGMYYPQVGRVLIDGVNIKQLEPLSLRQAIGYADERDRMFSGTLRDQLLEVNSDLSPERLIEIFEATGFQEEMARLNIDLDTILSENDIQLLPATFAKQFNLARSLAKSAKLYLLDEPENHLNSQQIECFMAYLEKRALREQTAFIISTKSKLILSYCHEKCTLNQGKLVNEL